MNLRKSYIALLFLLPLLGAAQNSLDFRQFYFNPFLFNPAYAGSSGFTEVTLAYRQQWMDFTDSPVASGFTVQHPLKDRASLGFNFFTQKSVAMRTSSAQVTYAYRVPFGKDHSLRFALSGGLGIDDLDLEGRDYSNDPLILQAAQNQVYAQGSFGLLYTKGDLQVGFTLPTLFNHQELGEGPLKIHPLQHLVNQLYTVRYKVDLKDNRFSLEPYVLYRLNRDLQNYFEAATILHYKNQLRMGISYHQYNGVGLFLGLTFKNQYSLGYAYEVPRKKYTASGAHEFQMAMRFGDVRAEPLKSKGSEMPTEVLADTPPPLHLDLAVTEWLITDTEFGGAEFHAPKRAISYMEKERAKGNENLKLVFDFQRNQYVIIRVNR